MTRAELLEKKRALAAELLDAAPAPQGEADWAQKARADAAERLAAMGGPVKRDEYWKYTDPVPFLAAPGAPVQAAPLDGVEMVEIRFEDGKLASDPPQLEGVEIVPLADALAEADSFAHGLFGVLEKAGQEKVDRPLAALSTAREANGLAIRVTGPVETPIHIRMTGVPRPLRHVVRVESGGMLNLAESGASVSVTLEADIDKAGDFEHVRAQTGERGPELTHIFARIGAEGRLKTFTLTADGARTRNEVVFDLIGDDAIGHAAGAVLGKAAAHVDNTVFVTHSALNGESRQVYKNVLEEDARAVFQGKIFVREGAQKTDGYQISQSILLSEGASFQAKPELEIYADDVACSHGSTTGAIDEEAMFYLRARGMPKKRAEALLVAAFADEAIEEIAHEGLADAMRALVAAWMDAR